MSSGSSEQSFKRLRTSFANKIIRQHRRDFHITKKGLSWERVKPHCNEGSCSPLIPPRPHKKSMVEAVKIFIFRNYSKPLYLIFSIPSPFTALIRKKARNIVAFAFLRMIACKFITFSIREGIRNTLKEYF